MIHSPVFQRRPVLQTFCRLLMRLSGWKVTVDFPDAPKYVLIFAHHTSNWDFPIGLMIVLAIGFWPHWIGKASLFKPPFGPLMRWLGGIPVERGARHNVVDQVVTMFNTQPALVVAMTPEGTRSKTEYWKTGFYHIARGANVPIVLSYLDYKRKIGAIGLKLMPTGDIEADLAVIREFYSDVTGKHPERHGEIQLRVIE
jgi:1-acyl-sn-glycerol-3-phosphate acyltransferase